MAYIASRKSDEYWIIMHVGKILTLFMAIKFVKKKHVFHTNV